MDSTTARTNEGFYERFVRRVAAARRQLARPLTFAEKVLFSHLTEQTPLPVGDGYKELLYRADRLIMQDLAAAAALREFMTAGPQHSAVRASIHCDHSITAGMVLSAEEREILDFLSLAAARFDFDFWSPGAGIIHQVVFERYAFPGGILIGTDSHSCSAGGLGMLAIEVRTSEAAAAMAGMPCKLPAPELVGIQLSGALQGWASPKDVILKLLGMFSIGGATGALIEYFGSGAAGLNSSGKATIANMGSELGAAASIFPFDAAMLRFLRGVRRFKAAEAARHYAGELSADPGVLAEPERFFDEVRRIDLGAVTPQWAGPHTPDLITDVSKMRELVRREGFPDEIASAQVGGCSGASYEDIARASAVARQAARRGLKVKAPLIVTPGSARVHAALARDGLLEPFHAVGADVRADGCRGCLNKWQSRNMPGSGSRTLVSSYNRNFPQQRDRDGRGVMFLGSPELVTAAALAGKISFDPRRDTLPAPDGGELRLEPPQDAQTPAFRERAGDPIRADLLQY